LTDCKSKERFFADASGKRNERFFADASGKRNERFFADASQNVLLPCCYTIITVKIYLQILKSLQVIILKDSKVTIETTTKRK
jgi:hypothetical protein